MTFTPDGPAPPGIPLLGCSPPHRGEVQVGLWGGLVWAQTKVQSLDLGSTCMGTNTGTIYGLREHLYGHKHRYNLRDLGTVVWAQTQVQSMDLGSTCTNTGTIPGLRDHLYVCTTGVCMCVCVCMYVRGVCMVYQTQHLYR